MSTPPLLAPPARHLVGRFSYGVTPALARDVERAGGAPAWFEQQLTPEAVADPETDELVTWWPALSADPAMLWQLQILALQGSWQVMADYQRWVLLRRMRSRRQLFEVMAEFWENHLNVPAIGDTHFVHRTAYGLELRKHALGRFDDLLHAAVTHPAMLLYLDNNLSTATHPNENLGRELLELHTVGRGHYTEEDVRNSARILTGWSVERPPTWAPVYKASAHWRGPVRVMGFRDANAAKDGRALTRRYLTYLAHHPATAQRVAGRLATKFVRDDPPRALVAELAQVYLDNDTAIAPVLRALVASKAFAGAVGSKVRDPGEDLVASYRALDVKVLRPATEESAANALLSQVSRIGTVPFGWPQPDGQPIDNDSWANPSRLLASMQTHRALSGGWSPREGASFRTWRSWLREVPIRFDQLVDHLAHHLLHRRSSPRLLKACCQAVSIRSDEVITGSHPLVRSQMPDLLATFLDSPEFLTR
jgi:uncharacterized protein (DUF1800 family)